MLGVMRKTTLLLLVVAGLCVSSALASELCPEVAPHDMRIPESAFSQGGAVEALETLGEIVEGQASVADEFVTHLGRHNAQAVLEGYFLRREALLERNGASLYQGSIARYCGFLAKAFWHD